MENKQTLKEKQEVEKKLVTNDLERDIVSIPFIEEVEIDDAFIEKLEKNIENYRKLITLSLKLTNEQDWTNQQGKPYLDSSGAEKIANPFGIQITQQRSQREDYQDNKGQYYIWKFTSTFSSAKLGRVPGIEFSGIASSRDKFSARVTRYVNGEPITELKPIEEIDQVRIQQKAQTNMIVNGIKRLIGLRNLTWEQLEVAGLKKDKIIAVHYQEGKEKSKPTQQQPIKVEEKKKLFG